MVYQVHITQTGAYATKVNQRMTLRLRRLEYLKGRVGGQISWVSVSNNPK